ncbi:hypothetical protein [Streptomyces sp. NPDC059918]|uniref:hypothetical protein n=1 Tax=unclassified Streptomyces TaxID=2593676 RepID=UPI00364887AF
MRDGSALGLRAEEMPAEDEEYSSFSRPPAQGLVVGAGCSGSVPLGHLTLALTVLTRRKKPNAAVRGPIQPAEAEVLLRVRVDGGIDPHDAAQRQAPEDLAAAEMVVPGGVIDRFHGNVLFSLLGLPASSLPTDNNSAYDTLPRNRPQTPKWSSVDDVWAAYVRPQAVVGR